MDFIIAAKNGIEVDCLYNGYRKETLITNKIVLKYGDKLKVENKGRYIIDVGWFVLISVNNKVKEYMYAGDLQEHIHEKRIVSPYDCMLEYFALSYQLDQALEKRDKEAFLLLSKKKKPVSELYDVITGKTIIHS